MTVSLWQVLCDVYSLEPKIAHSLHLSSTDVDGDVYLSLLFCEVNYQLLAFLDVDQQIVVCTQLCKTVNFLPIRAFVVFLQSGWWGWCHLHILRIQTAWDCYLWCAWEPVFLKHLTFSVQGWWWLHWGCWEQSTVRALYFLNVSNDISFLLGAFVVYGQGCC